MLPLQQPLVLSRQTLSTLQSSQCGSAYRPLYDSDMVSGLVLQPACVSPECMEYIFHVWWPVLLYVWLALL